MTILNISDTEKDYSDALAQSKVNNTTDLVYQEVQVYIEGVQVPFNSCSVNQAIGNLPSAVISLPPAPGLMDIARYYQPKVHIFYTDLITGGQRLLFWGHISSVSYDMSVNSSSISFQCIHKNNLLNQVTMDFRGWASESGGAAGQSNTNQLNSVYQAENFGSAHSLMIALEGISRVKVNPNETLSFSNPPNELCDELDQELATVFPRLYGMPGAISNMWNQLKISAFHMAGYNSMLSTVYIPLVEQGLGFFKRMSGHNLLEDVIQASRLDACLLCENYTTPGTKLIVPPSFRLNSMSSVQSAMALEAIRAGLRPTGEVTGFLRLITEFFYSIEYELITLASPASVPTDPTIIDMDSKTPVMAVETIVKPQLPFYYSPICNVVLPNMYSSIHIDQAEDSIYSRVDVVHESVPGQTGGLGLTYRGPASIRESIVSGIVLNSISGVNANLQNTTASSYNIPGKYELGMGLKPKIIAAPSWLASMVVEKSQIPTSTQTEGFPPSGTIADQLIKDMQTAWNDRYAWKDVIYPDGTTKRIPDPDKSVLNPFSKDANIQAFQRLIFAHADYDYTKNVLSSRTGSLQGVFNPYIVPGYPMDILAKSPNSPSFHALCTSVTHSFSANGISTSVSFMSAATYTELSNYHNLPVHPWLQGALNIVNVARGTTTTSTPTTTPVVSSTSPNSDTFSSANAAKINNLKLTADYSTQYKGNIGDPVQDGIHQSLLNNDVALQTAQSFYLSVLGVGAATPTDLVEFLDMSPTALNRYGHLLMAYGSSDSQPLPNGGEGNDNKTVMGNLRLVHRLIESRANIEGKSDIKFIDLNQSNYGGTPAAYVSGALTDPGLLEPGASMFLEYPEVKDFLTASGITKVAGNTPVGPNMGGGTGGVYSVFSN